MMDPSFGSQRGAPAGEAKRWHRPLFLAVSAVVSVAVVVLAHEVMLPIVLGLLIAFVLTPLVARVERWKLPRGAAILVVYVVVLGSIGLLVRLTAPRIVLELTSFAREVPAMTRQVKAEVIPRVQERLRSFSGVSPPAKAIADEAEEPALVVRPRDDGSFAVEMKQGLVVRQTREGWAVDRARSTAPFDPDQFMAESLQSTLAYAQKNALELARVGGVIVAAVSRFFFVFSLTLMIAAYVMLTRERIFAFFLSLVRPSSRDGMQRLVARIDRGLAGVVRGQIIICLINGALSAVGFVVLDLKYWPILTILATVLSLIPIFGSIVSAIPAVALGLTQSFTTGLLVLLWIIGIHQMEANLLNPKIMGDAAKIHPVLVIFSLLVGEHFFHITGALLAVPCMSIAQSVFIHFRQIVQQTDPELAMEPVASIPPPPPVARQAPPE